MSDVFLSYARADQPTARLFATGLADEGFTVWWDQSLSAGEAFDKVTERALDEARAVVVLWSRTSVESRWVRAEATQAQANQRLVPVMIEPCKRPIMFELTHTADLSDWVDDQTDPRWRAFVDGLRKLVVVGAAAELPASAAASATAGPLAAGPTQWRRLRRKRIGWGTAAALSLVTATAGALAVWWTTSRRTNDSPVAVHLSLSLAGRPASWPFGTRHIDIARDGSRIAFNENNGLWVRALGEVRPTVIDVECIDPFFSPDASWVGCFNEAGVMKVRVDSGTPVLIAANPDRQLGATWATDGSILFATTAGLLRVAEDGGEPELIASPDAERDERLYAWPELLPGEQHALLTVIPRSTGAPPRIVHLDLRTGESRVVLTGGSAARYASTGHLVYASGTKLYAIRFDVRSGETSGAPVTVPDIEIATAADNGAAEFALAADGTLVSMAPRLAAGIGQLSWVEPSGEETPLALTPGPYRSARVSPDGSRLVFDMNVGDAGNRDIWIFDLSRSSLARLTNDPAEENLPVWSHDGRRVFFSSNRGGNFDVYSQTADGSDEARVEVAAPGTQMLVGKTPDGRELLVIENFRSVGVIELDRQVLRPLLTGDVAYWLPAISPDGRWIAYESNESGNQVQIFLRPYPEVRGRRETISIDGGRYPVWGPAGSNVLYYVNAAGEMMAAEVVLAPELRLGAVRKLFDWQVPPTAITGPAFDVSPTDGRLLIYRVQADPGATVELSVTLHWLDELRKLAPPL